MENGLDTPTVAKTQPEAVRAFDRAHERFTAAAVEMAEALAAIDATAAFRFEQCSSVREWAERRKLAASFARVLCELVDAFRQERVLETMVKQHEATIEATAAVGRVFRHPEVTPEERKEWIERLRHDSTRDVIQAVRGREADLSAHTKTYPLMFRLEHRHIEEFHRHIEEFKRARKFACLEAAGTLNFDQAFVHVINRYLDEVDPLRVKPGKRRKPDTTGATKGDWPAEVKRELLARTDGKCAIASCDNDIFTQNAHVCTRWKGGGFEAWCGRKICWPHHQDYDAGRIKAVKTAQGVVFVNVYGVVIGGRVKRPLLPRDKEPP